MIVLLAEVPELSGARYYSLHFIHLHITSKVFFLLILKFLKVKNTYYDTSRCLRCVGDGLMCSFCNPASTMKLFFGYVCY